MRKIPAAYKRPFREALSAFTISASTARKRALEWKTPGLHQARFSIINPLADKIDKMAGDQWYASPDNFWSGGVSEPETLYTESNIAAFQTIIYGA